MNPRTIAIILITIVGTYTLASCALGFVSARLIYAAESPR